MLQINLLYTREIPSNELEAKVNESLNSCLRIVKTRSGYILNVFDTPVEVEGYKKLARVDRSHVASLISTYPHTELLVIPDTKEKYTIYTLSTSQRETM